MQPVEKLRNRLERTEVIMRSLIFAALATFFCASTAVAGDFDPMERPTTLSLQGGYATVGALAYEQRFAPEFSVGGTVMGLGPDEYNDLVWNLGLVNGRVYSAPRHHVSPFTQVSVGMGVNGELDILLLTGAAIGLQYNGDLGFTVSASGGVLTGVAFACCVDISVRPDLSVRVGYSFGGRHSTPHR